MLMVLMVLLMVMMLMAGWEQVGDYMSRLEYTISGASEQKEDKSVSMGRRREGKKNKGGCYICMR